MRIKYIVAIAVVGLGTWVAGDLPLSAQRSPIVQAPAYTDKELSTYARTSWPSNGGDAFNRRYSPLTEINRDNVAKLKAVWRVRLNGSGVDNKYSGEAQPIVADGVIYIVTGANDVFAV